MNSPPRGIGKTTMETLERMALTTGMSTWDAIGTRDRGQAAARSARCRRSTGFRRLIEDARAMLGPGFAEKLTQDVAADDDERRR